jgi:hypothetical protein
MLRPHWLLFVSLFFSYQRRLLQPFDYMAPISPNNRYVVSESMCFDYSKQQHNLSVTAQLSSQKALLMACESHFAMTQETRTCAMGTIPVL